LAGFSALRALEAFTGFGAFLTLGAGAFFAFFATGAFLALGACDFFDFTGAF